MDVVSFIMGQKMSGGGGGGNPNYVQTITGTLANPWGDYPSQTLFSNALNNNITLLIRFNTGNAWTRDFPIYTDRHDIGYSGNVNFVETNGAEIVSAYWILWGTSLEEAFMYSSFTDKTDMSSMAAHIPTVLTIIHHPMTGSITPAENTTFGGD